MAQPVSHERRADTCRTTITAAGRVLDDDGGIGQKFVGNVKDLKMFRAVKE